MKIIDTIETSTSYSIAFDGPHGSYIGMLDLVRYLNDKTYRLVSFVNVLLSGIDEVALPITHITSVLRFCS